VGEWQDSGAGRPLCRLEEQLGGFHIVDVADLDAALSWAARCPPHFTAFVEVRPIMDKELSEIRAGLVNKEKNQ